MFQASIEGMASVATAMQTELLAKSKAGNEGMTVEDAIILFDPPRQMLLFLYWLYRRSNE